MLLDLKTNAHNDMCNLTSLALLMTMISFSFSNYSTRADVKWTTK